MGIRVYVIHRPISRNEVGFPLEPKHTGAILEYFHVVRQDENGQRISAMSFETDREELRKKLTKISERISKDYELTDLECFRRVGIVPAGEPCLLLRVASLHSQESFRAMSDFLTELRDIEILSEPIRA